MTPKLLIEKLRLMPPDEEIAATIIVPADLLRAAIDKGFNFDYDTLKEAWNRLTAAAREPQRDCQAVLEVMYVERKRAVIEDIEFDVVRDQIQFFNQHNI